MTRSLAGEQSVYRDKDVSLYLSSCKLLTKKRRTGPDQDQSREDINLVPLPRYCNGRIAQRKQDTCMTTAYMTIAPRDSRLFSEYGLVKA